MANTTNRTLPQPLLDAIEVSAALGKTSQTLVAKALSDLWFTASTEMSDSQVFVSTGDIPAMWIRDSTWQVRPLIRWVAEPQIRQYLLGVLAAQVKFLLIDPYANAFNPQPSGFCWHKDFIDQSPWVFERKFELDSISAFFHFSLDLAEAIGSVQVLTPSWWTLAANLIDLLELETSHDPLSYRFLRAGAPDHDHLSNDGYGPKFANTGMVWSAFRPSDDACELPFNVPANLHLATVLQRLSSYADVALGHRCTQLSWRILKAVKEYATLDTPEGRVYAYEVDGLGNQVLDEDANFPNLLSLPFLGVAPDGVYNNTRARSLSSQNAWFFRGKFAHGLGSPHTGPGKVWPLAIAMQGLTASDPKSKLDCLRMIEDTAWLGSIHESFDVDNPKDFTRQWFSWAQMMHLELAFQIIESGNPTK